LREKGRKD